MSAVADAVVGVFVWMIGLCYRMAPNYWAAIVLFTLFTKILLLPLSIWVQKNSIKTVRMQPEINRIKASFFGNSELISEEQYKIFKKYHYNPFADLIPLLAQLAILMGVAEAVKRATPLTAVPVRDGGAALLIPLFAALSAFLMCFAQNRSNVLQSEQSRLNQFGTLLFSVALSLYLGLFVAVGVGFYWVFSNLFSILQLWLLNFLIDPKKQIDYAALEESREALESAKRSMAKRSGQGRDPYRKKEKADYRRFLSTPGKKVVFYSERNGFYKYYQNVIEEIIRKTNIVVHYLTSDPKDEVFALESEQFCPYYISDYRMIILMMKLECDVMVMTTPDLDNYQLKRSYVKKDIEYIYLPHDVNSANLTFRKEALDHFDTVFCAGFKNREEIREREEKYGLEKKTLVEWGSSVIDNMIRAYADMRVRGEGEQKTLLIAPSWQKDNLLDLCIEALLDALRGEGYRIIVRPHPQYVRHFAARIDALAEKYREDAVEFQKDFSSNETVYTADLLITDWSSIAFEYAFSTLKPVLFINTPMKVMNQDYRELSTVPVDIELRDHVGCSIEPDAIPGGVKGLVQTLLYDARFSAEEMRKLRDTYIYHVGESGKIGASYIIRRLMEKQEERAHG